MLPNINVGLIYFCHLIVHELILTGKRDFHSQNLFNKAFENYSIRDVKPTSECGIHNLVGIKLISRLRLDLSHLNKHR